MKTKILIILIVLIVLSIGGFFVYKNISVSKEKVEEEEGKEEEVEGYKGIWLPTLLA